VLIIISNLSLHKNKIYELTNGEKPDDLAAYTEVISNMAGEEVQLISMSPEALTEKFLSLGLTKEFSFGLSTFFKEVVTLNSKKDMEMLLGRKPTKFEDWAVENIPLIFPQDDPGEEDSEDASMSFVIKKEIVGPKKCLLQVQVIANNLPKSFPNVLGEKLSRRFSKLMKKCLHMDPQACSIMVKRERNCFYFSQEKIQTFVVLCTVYSWQGAIPAEIQDKIKSNIHSIIGALEPDELDPFLEFFFLSL